MSDGINFKTSDQVIEVGGAGKASVAGFESFVTAFSDFVGKEINGYYLSNLGESGINYIGVAHYGNNKWNESSGAFLLQRARLDLVGKVSYHTVYHTHPSLAAEIDKLQASEKDRNYKESVLKRFPQLQRFIILTRGYSPIEY